jgi:hypothetical protein
LLLSFCDSYRTVERCLPSSGQLLFADRGAPRTTVRSLHSSVATHRLSVAAPDFLNHALRLFWRSHRTSRGSHRALVGCAKAMRGNHRTIWGCHRASVGTPESLRGCHRSPVASHERVRGSKNPFFRREKALSQLFTKLYN